MEIFPMMPSGGWHAHQLETSFITVVARRNIMVGSQPEPQKYRWAILSWNGFSRKKVFDSYNQFLFLRSHCGSSNACIATICVTC
ncbi:Zinc finger BED domain-containing protein DAYSLEEPER [Fusarium oxysporum f. sp. albedinis]|nr:Zinc finger BED domain-containing protein DAYSLEEPER [Fusarium oxysporum f. sp. albedinis]